ncbi:VOC family protein [Devosia marina]|uniref:VOC family protein n=1 Tax=Devosia marina TaxID=2683198 RepID=A0A7X3FNM7_9HYPH|nr:VOC family protein [Devosia marina]MVS97944.1 VOC family protein [Devosia marina]
MFSHVTVGSNDLERAGQFYDAVLLPLGLRRRVVEPDGGPEALCWVGKSPYPRFYVYAPFDGQAAAPGNGAMLAFIAPSKDAVIEAHTAGLAAGGRDEGAPGLRPHYAPDYFGAYLRDPDGNKVHLVFRAALLT